jgi:peptidoglycan/LPS O-acetylase OafA/YrhL
MKTTSISADAFASKTVDYARAFAILLVLMTHTGQQIRETETYNPNSFVIILKMLSEAGAAGVPLFFVISGFLMAFLHRTNFSQTVFWKKRFARIYPLWFLWTIVAVIAAYIPITFLGPEPIYVYGHGVTLDSVQNWILLFLQLTFMGWLVPTIWNSFVVGGWSIQAEMGNYALFAVLRKVKIQYLLWATAFVSALYLFFLSYFVPETYLNIANSAVTSPYWFFLGLFIADFLNSHNHGEKIQFSVWIALIAATSITLLLNGPFVSQLVSMIVIIAAITVSLLIAAKGQVGWLRVIGKYSYGMYFAHFLFILPLNRAHGLIAVSTGNQFSDFWAVIVMLLGFVFVVLGSLLVSMITFKFIESPIIAWSRKK